MPKKAKLPKREKGKLTKLKELRAVTGWSLSWAKKVLDENDWDLKKVRKARDAPIESMSLLVLCGKLSVMYDSLLARGDTGSSLITLDLRTLEAALLVSAVVSHGEALTGWRVVASSLANPKLQEVMRVVCLKLYAALEPTLKEK